MDDRSKLEGKQTGAAARDRPSALSYVHGASAASLIGDTIGRYFDQICAANADRLALVSCHQGVRWTYADLKRDVDAFAAGLLAQGLAPGERVGIWSPNCCEWLVAQYATAKAGLILVTINPAYRKAELRYALNKVGCKALIMAVAHKGANYVDMLRELSPELSRAAPGALSSAALPALRLVVTIGAETHAGCMRFEDVASNRPEDGQRLQDAGDHLQFDDAINIQFTSGTTGFPKGATLSHHNILNNAFFVGEALRLKAGDKLCAPVPLYHCFGMVMANLGCLTHAACVVYPAESFDPGATLEAVATERCSVLYGVPTMFIAMLNHPAAAQLDLSSLRTGIMAGSPCPIEVMREVVDRMHMPEVTIAYGMTETSPVSFQSSTDDTLERRVSTVGRIQPHLEVKLVDGEGRIVPRGRPGEICTRGYSVMLRYWDDPERTADVLDEAGWMHTGDLGVLDEQGYCNIVGRIKDMVIRGGENIYPREIEEFLFTHPAVQDAQVVGVPDPKYGEELCAWIILRNGERLEVDAVREFCRGQIAHYKVPRYIKFVSSFPTTVTGKVQKFLIREAMVAELGLAEQRTA